MKKNILITGALALTLTALFFNGCKKDDTTAPVVTLSGGDMTLRLNDSQPADPGATANDAEDGSVTTSSTWSATNPDMNNAGTYTITYTATDAAGNSGTSSRTVRVKNDAEDYFSLTGSDYGTTETPCSSNCTWVQSIKSSKTENNALVFGKFANYTNNNAIKGKIVTVSGVKYIILSPSTQTAAGIGTTACDHTFTNQSSNGSPIIQIGTKWSFSVNFNDQITNTSSSCTADPSPVPYTDTFLQQ
jgi:hypothetical protein